MLMRFSKLENFRFVEWVQLMNSLWAGFDGNHPSILIDQRPHVFEDNLVQKVAQTRRYLSDYFIHNSRPVSCTDGAKEIDMKFETLVRFEIHKTPSWDLARHFLEKVISFRRLPLSSPPLVQSERRI